MSLYSSYKALVIGISRYGLPHYDLSYARSDAEAMAALLADEFGFDHLWTLYDEEATRQKILQHFENDLQQTDEDDGLLIFFAGHGITVTSAIGDDRGFLVPHDGDPDRPFSNLSLTTIRDDYLPMIPAKHIFLIVDSCYGGLALRDLAVTKHPGSADDAYLSALTRRDRKVRQVLAAGTKDQRVLDGGLFGRSVFTGRLIEALRETDAHITADHVGVHVRERVARDSVDRNHRQTPQFGILFGGDGSFVFSRSKDRSPAPTATSTIAATTTTPADSQTQAVTPNLPCPVPDDLAEFRRRVFGHRCERLFRVAKGVELNLEYLPADLDLTTGERWLESNSGVILTSPFWFQCMDLDDETQRIKVLLRDIANVAEITETDWFSRTEAKSQIEDGPRRYTSNHYEGKTSFYRRAAYFYVVVFRQRPRAVEAINRAANAVDSVFSALEVALAVSYLLQDDARCRELWRYARAKAHTADEFVGLATYGTALAVEPIDVRELLSRAEGLATETGDLIDIAQAYFDLLGDVDSAESAAERACDAFDRESIHSDFFDVARLIERFVDAQQDKLPSSIAERIEEVGLPEILLGNYAGQLAGLWSNLLDNPKRGLGVLAKARDRLKRIPRKSQDSALSVDDWIAIGDAYMRMGCETDGRKAFRDAAKRLHGDISKDELREVLIKWGMSPRDFIR